MRKLLFFFLIAAVFGACSSVDCPLNNTVYTNYVLRGPGYAARHAHHLDDDK